MLMLPTTLTAANPLLNNGLLEVVFIDPGVVGWESLAQGVRPGVAVVLLDADQDGLAQMALWARSQKDVSALHVLSHGSSAQLNLGSLKLTTPALHDRSADLATLGAALTDEGDVLLYGCNVASGVAGAEFVALMADLTGADISASENATGSALFGGDWLLEAQVGPLDSVGPFDALVLDAYGGMLGVSDLNFDTVPSTQQNPFTSVNIADWIFSGSNSYAVGNDGELGAGLDPVTQYHRYV